MSPRNNRTARKAGSAFERNVANYLAEHVDDRIDRRVRTGAKDRGDIAGVRTFLGGRVVIECKNTTKALLGPWLRETDLERGNDDAVAGVVVHKRIGVSDRGEDIASQAVTMTLRDLAALLTGTRPPGELVTREPTTKRARAVVMPGTVPLPLPEFDTPIYPEGSST